MTNLATVTTALAPLANLQAAASKPAKRWHNRLRFYFPRTAVERLPALAELQATGLEFRVYTGQQIHRWDGQEWHQRQAKRLRGYTVVEVTL